jgi:hypothetical protein
MSAFILSWFREAFNPIAASTSLRERLDLVR